MTTKADAASSGRGTCLDTYIPSFESRLTERNYKPGTIKTYRVQIRRLASLMAASGVAPD